MNTYSSLRRKNNGRIRIPVYIFLFVLLSGIILAGRILTFSLDKQCHYIPLTKGNASTNISYGQVQENGDILFHAAAACIPKRPVLLTATSPSTASWFQATDKNGVWKGQTDIDIFRISYKNGAGQVTVNGRSGEKVLAPGTSNLYSFAPERTGKNALAYEMQMEAFFSAGSHTIPVVAKVYDHNGDYLAGSSEEHVDILDLTNVSDSGTLQAGYVMPYTLEWQWPFEGDDAYDTMLGDLAVNEDITLTIVIKTLASYTPSSDEGVPKTGDTSELGFMIFLMFASGTALLYIFFLYTRKGDLNEKA